MKIGVVFDPVLRMVCREQETVDNREWKEKNASLQDKASRLVSWLNAMTLRDFTINIAEAEEKTQEKIRTLLNTEGGFFNEQITMMTPEAALLSGHGKNDMILVRLPEDHFEYAAYRFSGQGYKKMFGSSDGKKTDYLKAEAHYLDRDGAFDEEELKEALVSEEVSKALAGYMADGENAVVLEKGDFKISARNIMDAFEFMIRPDLEQFVKELKEKLEERPYDLVVTGPLSCFVPADQFVKASLLEDPNVKDQSCDVLKRAWDLAERASRYQPLSRIRIMDPKQILIAGDKLLYIDPADGSLQGAAVDGKVRKISGSRSYQAFLKDDGTMRVLPSSSRFDRDTLSEENVTDLCAMPQCLFTVHSNGRVKIYGNTDLLVKKTDEVKKIFGGFINAYPVLAQIGRDGKTYVSSAEEFEDESPELIDEVEKWENMETILIGSGVVAGLSDIGKVRFVSVDSADARSACREWEDVTSLVLCGDKSYILGLTGSGRVLMAGNPAPAREFGRKDALNWRGVAYLAADNKTIRGVTRDGKVLSTGEGR